MGLFNFFKKKKKVFVIGLDCAAPELVFHRWRDDLPNLRKLMTEGVWGELSSAIPAITVPAWSSMLSSKDPGVLGIYGFRNRSDYSYDKMFVANGDYVKEKRVWDYLSAADLQNVVIGVPQTYPVKPLNGHLISGFLTPDTNAEFTWPPAFKNEVLNLEPEYDFDVKKFRTNDKEWLLSQIYEMTERRFNVVDYCLKNKPWDFFMLMEIGTDRIHHGFWDYHDPQHFKYQPGSEFENAIHDYYVFIDTKIGQWLNQIDENTAVIVVSDHGAKRLDGGICINEWLWKNGYLAFENDPPMDKPVSFEKLKVDWKRTKVWGSGGYYARIFFNVEGREPNGIIPQSEYESFRDEFAAKIRAIPDHNGNPLPTKTFKPEELYKKVNNVAPDLMVYFGDLLWRSVGSVGHGSFYTFDNDTGPDSCNHAQNGMFILHDPANPGKGQEITGAQLMDIAPTVLDLFGVEIPEDMQGRVISHRKPNLDVVYDMV
ncbi:MAG: alkaline phosphatase family protein [Calditrichaeota bacterium]|nr:alkaline phosphatase family protein [Calditrichota bacterium]MCB0269708.1 alkaline phosphatase family protein [Calditrichota bacterium]MCB0300510.1 alkaline phosphatase family protein [Calditrichota bacterium]MCB9066202.1 alkaline phosphatase family protein [Calditrichia bacterium]